MKQFIPFVGVLMQSEINCSCNNWL